MVQMDSTASEDYLDNLVVMAKTVRWDDVENQAELVTEAPTVTRDHAANPVDQVPPVLEAHEDLEDPRVQEVTPARVAVMERTVALEHRDHKDHKEQLDVQDSLELQAYLAVVESQEHLAKLVQRDQRVTVDLQELMEFKDLVDAQDLRVQ